MEEYYLLFLLFVIEGIVALILAYKGLWNKWGNVVQTVVQALQDGKITQEEFDTIISAIQKAMEK